LVILGRGLKMAVETFMLQAATYETVLVLQTMFHLLGNVAYVSPPDITRN
jgi:hypothetical protein